MFVARYSGQILNFFLSVFLSRVLTPSDFGVFAIIVLVAGFFSVIGDFGFKSFIVQNKELSNNDYSFIFWFSFLIGFILFVIVVILSDFLSVFFKIHELGYILKIMSSQLIFYSLSILPLSLLEKKLEFKAIAFSEIISISISSIVCVILALNKFGFWALIGFYLINTMTLTFMLWSYISWRPIFKLQYGVINKLFHFSGFITLFNVSNYWTRNIDNLLIARYIGPSALGFYSRAYTLMTYPIVFLSGILNPISHSIFSKLEKNDSILANNYFELLSVIALINFPIISYALINAEFIITFVWGEKWLETVKVFYVLGIAAFFQPIYNTVSTIFYLKNKTKLFFLFGLFNMCITLIGVFIGLSYGLTGVAIGYVIVFYIMQVPLFYLVIYKLLNSSLILFLQKLKIALLVLFCSLFFYALINSLFNSLLFSFIINSLVAAFVLFFSVRNVTKRLKINSVGLVDFGK